jgi:glutathione S-transferase
MIELYHSLHSTCSQKVRLCLEEKGLPWTGHHLNLRQFDQLRPEFLKLNPQALVPVLVDAGRVITESRIINEYLEEQYPETPLMPASAYERAQVRAWSQYVDSVPAEAVKLPSFVKNIQPELQKMGIDQALPMIEKIPNPHIQARWRRAATTGIAPQDLAPSHAQLKAMVERMDQALQGHKWLCGDTLTLADLDIAPFVQRLVRIDLFHWVEQHPRVLAWFHQIRSRPAYKRAMPEPGSEGTLPP